MAVSALRYAMSSCERLALGYKCDFGAAQAKLRRPGEGVVRQSSSSQYVPEQGHDRGNQVRHRAVTNRRSITKAIGGMAEQRAAAVVFGSAARCGRGCFCRLASPRGKRQSDAPYFPSARSVHRSNRGPARPMRRDPQCRRLPSDGSASLKPMDGC